MWYKEKKVSLWLFLIGTFILISVRRDVEPEKCLQRKDKFYWYRRSDWVDKCRKRSTGV